LEYLEIETIKVGRNILTPSGRSGLPIGALPADIKED